MFFPGKTLGLEIFQNGISFVMAGGSKSIPHIERYDVVRFPKEVIKPSLKDPNITEASLLKDAISASYERLSSKNKRLSLSIPDSAGKVLIVEMEIPLKNKAEGIDHVR